MMYPGFTGARPAVSIVSVVTSASGAAFTAFAAKRCKELDLVNTSGVAIEYLRDGVGTAFPVPTGSGRMIIGLTDASQVSVRRVDQSATQVTVNGEAIA